MLPPSHAHYRHSLEAARRVRILISIVAAIVLAATAAAAALTAAKPGAAGAAALRVPFPPIISFVVAGAFLAALALAFRRYHVVPKKVEYPKFRAGRAPRLLMVVLDGAADRKNRILNGKTALEAAAMPHLNSLASKGHMGVLRPLPGIAPESDEAVLAILGYDPKRYYVGRGAFEAIGLGLPFHDGDVALRANFSCVKGNKLVSARSDLTEEEAEELVAHLNKNLSVENAAVIVAAGVAYRAALVIRSKNRLSDKISNRLSDRISNTHPGYKRVFVQGHPISKAVAMGKEPKACVPLERSAEAEYTARLVNQISLAAYRLLAEHPINKRRAREGKEPANYILLRDAAAKMPRLPPMRAKTDHEWAIVADMPVEIGIGRAAGMSVIKVPPASPTDKGALEMRAAKALHALNEYECVYVHLKGPDIFSHAGDPLSKVLALQMLDEHFFGALLKKLDLSSTVVCVTCDHTTSSEEKRHTADGVPVLVYAPGFKGDGLYFEEHTRRVHIVSGMPRRGTLGKMKGHHLVPFLMWLMRHARSEKVAEEAVARAAALAR